MFVLKHRSGKSNKVVNALSQRKVLLKTMSIVVVSLECVKGLYEEDSNFATVGKECIEPWSMDRTPFLYYHIRERFFFMDQQLCIP
jgi:hypothetical protein